MVDAYLANSLLTTGNFEATVSTSGLTVRDFVLVTETGVEIERGSTLEADTPGLAELVFGFGPRRAVGSTGECFLSHFLRI